MWGSSAGHAGRWQRPPRGDHRAGSYRVSAICLMRGRESYSFFVEETVWTGAWRQEQELSVQGK